MVGLPLLPLSSPVSSGIGAALALEYARPGVHLILVARNVERLEKVKSQCIAKGATAEIQSLDMSNSQEVKRYMTEVDNRVGVDLVVANAGISMTEPRKGEIESDAAQVRHSQTRSGRDVGYHSHHRFRSAAPI